MGVPVLRFVAALNANDVIARYLETGVYRPAQAVTTISNAMDVGDPGNLPRVRSLFMGDIAMIRNAVYATSCTDLETRGAIAGAFAAHGYVLDPHGAVAYAALDRFRRQSRDRFTGVVLETAHPAKFLDAYEGEIRKSITTPRRLDDLLGGGKRSIRLPSRFDEVRTFLMADV